MASKNRSRTRGGALAAETGHLAPTAFVAKLTLEIVRNVDRNRWPSANRDDLAYIQNSARAEVAQGLVYVSSSLLIHSADPHAGALRLRPRRDRFGRLWAVILLSWLCSPGVRANN
jgi:hypothetical protein